MDAPLTEFGTRSPGAERLSDSFGPRLLAAFVTVVAGGWFLASLRFPLGEAQAYRVLAARELLAGGAPASAPGAGDGPLVLWLFAAIERLASGRLWVPRLAEALLLIVSALSIGRLGRLVGGGAGAWIAPGYYLLWMLGGGVTGTLEPRAWAAGAVAIWVDQIWRTPPVSTTRRRLGAAAMVLVVTALDPRAVPLVLLVPVATYAFAGDRRQEAGEDWWIMGAAVIAAWAAAVAALAATGRLGLATQTVRDAFQPGPARDPATWVATFRALALDLGLGGALPLSVAAAVSVLARRHARGLFLVLWAFLAGAAVLLEPAPGSARWSLAFPPMALLMVQAWKWFADRGRVVSFLATLLMGASLAASAARPVFHQLSTLARFAGRVGPVAYLEAVGLRPGADVLDQQATATWLRGIAGPGDEMVDLGGGARVRARAALASPARLGAVLEVLRAPEGPERARRVGELVRALKAHPPAFLVVPRRPFAADAGGLPIPELEPLVRDQYMFAATHGRLEVLVRNDHPEAARLREAAAAWQGAADAPIDPEAAPGPAAPGGP